MRPPRKGGLNPSGQVHEVAFRRPHQRSQTAGSSPVLPLSRELRKVVRLEAHPASSRGAVSSDAETELLYSASLSSGAASARPLRGWAGAQTGWVATSFPVADWLSQSSKRVSPSIASSSGTSVRSASTAPK